MNTQTQKNVPELRFPAFSGEWSRNKLGLLATIKTGNKDTQNKNDRGKYPFFVRSDNIEKIDSYSLDCEAVLTSGDGVGVGKNFHYINGKFDFHQRVYAIYDFNNLLNCMFFYQFFKQNFLKRVIRLSAKNSVDSVRMSMISEMKIPCPIIEEQQKIADFLTAVDEKITALREKKEALTTYKKGVMQQLFSGTLRFTQDDSTPYPDWEEKKLGNLAKRERSNVTLTDTLGHEEGFPVYGAAGHVGYLPSYRIESDYIAIIKDGAGVGRMIKCKGKSSILATLDVILPRGNTDLLFLYNFMQTIHFEKYNVGSTIPHIYYKDYAREKVNVPCVEEQKKIGEFLNALDHKIECTEQSINSATRFKKSLLQKMFV